MAGVVNQTVAELTQFAELHPLPVIEFGTSNSMILAENFRRLVDQNIA